MGYDAANRITSVNFTKSTYDAEDVTYDYDRTDQLTSADRSTTDEAYSYDETGNRTMTGWVTGANNRLDEDPTFIYGYDEEGNRTSRVRQGSAQADDKTVEYSWDHRNRLTKVTFKRNDGTVTKTIDYSYDMFDRLTTRVMDPDGALGTASVITNDYIWDGKQIVFYDFSHQPGQSRFYMYGPDGKLLFEQSPLPNVLYAVLTDHLGTMRDLVNTSGTTVNHIVYDSYGGIVSETLAAPLAPRVRFTGQLFDYQAGLNYHHHRWYDPAAGRWISEDPLAFAADDVNLSRYVWNSPTVFTDPTGFEGLSDCARSNRTGRCNMKRDEFEEKYQKLYAGAWGKTRMWSKGQNDMLNRGCIGLVALELTPYRQRIRGRPVTGEEKPYPEMPEDEKGTKCYMKEADADKRICPNGTRNVVWAKHGKWRNGLPRPLGDGTIPNDSVIAVDGLEDYNYVVKKEGCYWWADSGVEALPEGQSQMFSIMTRPTPFIGYPNHMWCSTCVSTGKGDPNW